MPGGGVFGDAFGFGAVAAGAGFGEVGDLGEPRGIVSVGEASVVELRCR